MAFNFIDTVYSYFGNELIGKAEIYLNEGTVSVKKGLEAIIPVSLNGIVKEAETDPESVLSLAREASNSGISNRLYECFTPGGGGIPSIGPTLINNILGDKFGSTANSISSFAGLKGSSTASLFGIILPFALSLLGKHAQENNLSAGELSALLSSQKSSILSAIPADLGIKLKDKPQEVFTNQGVIKKRNRWIIPTLLAFLVVFILVWLMRTCNKETTPVAPTTTTTDTASTIKTEAVVINKEPVRLMLPDGIELEAYKGGIEDLLIAFINDSTATITKDNWFDFNELNFKFGTAEIIPESESELNNIVKILQAYPKVKIKIGGYTDKVGDEATNKKLSQDRANAILEALKTAGVGNQVVGAEGYGSEFAKFPAEAPEEDRIKDRRVSVSVREK
ncbi:OmpA family protein [Solitalea sp. MAHUQ-68]|uniref:OmpA family protein n=1 Tax=Solitalea agri TaxID=2953739 RepID=A0A9X2F4K6_9SPHI|nr:OmpA family protein [Solitalea agri]MCO4294632.1 OmpA family protein [Solitalea agri]